MYKNLRFQILIGVLYLAAILCPSYAQTAETTTSASGAEALAGDAEELPVVWYDVNRALIVNCTLPNPSKAPIVWEKNGTAVDAVADLKGRFELKRGGAEFSIQPRAHEDDFGNYTCRANASAGGDGGGDGGGGGGAATYSVRGRPHCKLPPDTNVVEGHRLKLQCRVLGKPYAAAEWLYRNATLNETLATAATALGARVRLQPNEQGAPDAELLLAEAARHDAGEWTCRVGAARASSTVRVKDMYAALWPFLGICAEVFVLCAIILVYERRRTKPEPDDSDADNHDQKKS